MVKQYNPGNDHRSYVLTLLSVHSISSSCRPGHQGVAVWGQGGDPPDGERWRHRANSPVTCRCRLPGDRWSPSTDTVLQASSGRKCEKCRCPLCMDPNRTVGDPTMHLCHYPNCGKVYKKTSHLRAHLRWHIGDQPYLCSWPG